MSGCLTLVALAVIAAGIALSVMAVQGYRRSGDALHELERLDGRLDALNAQLAETARHVSRLEAERRASGAPATEVSLAPAAAPPAQVAATPAPLARAALAPPVEPAAAPVRAIADASVKPLPSAAAAEGPASPAASSAAESLPPVTRRTSGSDTLESQIGGKWFLVLGAAVFVLGIGFFVKMAFDNHWINETARVVIGGAVGLGMIGAGAWFIRRGYDLYGQIVTGAGYVAIFISLYAAYAIYGLIDRTPVFLLFALTAAAAAVSADRLGSAGLASMAILGGFITPFLVGGDTDSQVTLLSYDGLLVGGTMYLASRRSWPLLNLMSFALTGMTFVGWADRWYTSAKYLPTEFFLVVFCAMFLYVLRETRRKDDQTAQLASTVLWSGPIIFHLASINNLFRHSEALLIYLVVASAVTVGAATRLGRPWVRLAAWLAAVIPFLAWFAGHTQPEWRVAGVTVLFALYGMHLLAQVERVVRRGEEPDLVDIAIFHLNGLGLFAGLYVLVDKSIGTGTSLVALALALWSGVLAALGRRFGREAGAQGLALSFGMMGFAIGLQFDDRWATVGWTAEAVAVVWTGLLMRREWMRAGGALLLGLSLFRLFDAGFFATPSGFTVVLNSRVGATLVIVGLLYLLAYIHRAAAGYLKDAGRPEIATLVVGASMITLALVTVEITSYFKVQEAEVATASLARGMSLSLAWGLYGVALVVVGIMQRYRPIRYLAILLLAMTAAKVLVVDLSELGGVYRIMGFIGMGALLLVGSFLYQRFRSIIVGTDE
jgi:uncharacterized membrane protein